MNDTCEKHDGMVRDVQEIKTHVQYLREAREKEEKAKGTWFCFLARVAAGALQGALGGAFALLLWYLKGTP